MGQAQSDEYQCDGPTRDVADSEINSRDSEVSTIARAISRTLGLGTGGHDTANKNNLTKTSGHSKEQQHVRKLSNVSHRHVQLLSMKPRSEKDAFVDNLRTRRRSSLINLILGAPSSGPRFSDDLCSLSSHLSECNFGIEFFPEVYHTGISVSSLRLESIEDVERSGASALPTLNLGQPELHQSKAASHHQANSLPGTGRQRRRGSSLGGLPEAKLATANRSLVCENPSGSADVQKQQATGSSISRDGSVMVAVGGNGFAERVGEGGNDYGGKASMDKRKLGASSSEHAQLARQQFGKSSQSNASNLASIDLTSSFEQHDRSGTSPPSTSHNFYLYKPHWASNLVPSSIFKSKQITPGEQEQHMKGTDNNWQVEPSKVGQDIESAKIRANRGRLNQSARILRRTASELSLYSTVSDSDSCGINNGALVGPRNSISDQRKKSLAATAAALRETKLIITLQVCIPFILAGFGNMAAGLVLNQVAQWRSFKQLPIFFVLLPPLIGMKGNIEMTLASRLSTLANLNMLDTTYQRRRAYLSNLILITSQAVGLSIFAAFISVCAELMTNKSHYTDFSKLFEIAILVVLASAIATSLMLAIISSFMMSLAIALAKIIQVNPDNLSTLVAAMYGDVSFVIVYGLIAEWMFSLREQGILTWPLIINFTAVALWPTLVYLAYKFKETQSIALSSLPPMLTSIMISMGSGTVLAHVVDKFKLIALYQPVVNGFGANLIAVQASRVSTWLWCSALRKMSTNKDLVETPKKTYGSLASFVEPVNFDLDENSSQTTWTIYVRKIPKTLLWSFCNPSPNSTAAKLLLIMLIPAQTIYFLVIWLLSEANYVVLTWPFYFAYLSLCLVQVFTLLAICEPLMTFLMRRNLDPDVFGISTLMALADLTGTVCLAGAFFLLATLGDINAV